MALDRFRLPAAQEERRRSVKGSAAKLIHGAAGPVRCSPGTMLCYSMGCLQHTQEAHAAASEGLGRSQQQTCAAALPCCVLPPQTQANTGNTWIKQAVRNPSALLTRVMPPTPRCLRICADTHHRPGCPSRPQHSPLTRVMPPISLRKPPAAMMRARSSGCAGLWSSAGQHNTSNQVFSTA